MLQRADGLVVAQPPAAPAIRSRAPESLVSLPSFAIAAAIGLLIVALADDAGRVDSPLAGAFFWIGLVAIFAPLAWRLTSIGASPAERAGLVALCAVALYLVKVLQYPTQFTYHDELSHWRTLDDILQGGHLFSLNPLLPISALYPGLENVAAALVRTGGLGVFLSGIIVVGAAKVALALALYLFYEQASGSARLAGVAALIYMANPSFLFFDSQFAYESLGVPLAIVTLLAVSKQSVCPRIGGPWTLVGVLALIAAITTHHLTGLLLAGFLIIWSATQAYTSRTAKVVQTPMLFALLGVLGTFLWIVLVSRNTIGYLIPDLRDSLGDLGRLVSGQVGMRRLFSDYAGQSLPLWERLASYLSIALILLGLPFGLLRVVRGHRSSALALALGIATLAYPLSLALRLSLRGVEASVRSSEFLFIAIGFVLALALEELVLSRSPDVRARLLVVCGGVAIFLGGIVLGWAPLSRLPGAYLVAADPRSIEPQGVSAAWWARSQLGPDRRFDADRINMWLMGSYGHQRVVSALVDHVGVWPLLLTPTVDSLDRQTVVDGRIRYLVVDLRLASSLPHVGVYVEQGEADEFRHTQPLPLAALTKFDRLDGVSRLFDSGDIAIYDVGALGNAKQ